MDGTEIVALIRDLAFIALFAAAAVTAVVLGLKALAVARSVGRLLRSVRAMRAAVAREMQSATAAAGVEAGAGVVESLIRRIRGRNDA